MDTRLRQSIAIAWVLGLSQSATGAAASPAAFYRPPQIELGTSYERLTNGYANWRHQSASLSLPLQESGLLAAHLQNVERYLTRDQSLGVSYSRNTPAGIVQLGTTQSSNPVFLASHVYELGLTVSLATSNNLLIAYKDSEYKNNRSRNKNIGFESYFGNYRLAYTATYSTLNSMQSGWSNAITAQWLGERARVGIAFAKGREPTELAANNLINAKTETIELNGVLPVSRRLSVTGSLWQTQQDRFYSRTGAQVGLRISY